MQKFLIVGLGNKGVAYEETRHNIGFKIVEALAQKYQIPFDTNHFGWIAQLKEKGRYFILLKPDTYMNLSGNAVKYWLQKEKIPIENLLIITDDLNLEFGTIRIKSKGSDGGHNGLKSLQESLQTIQYPRLRFGISNRFDKGKQVDYVLGKWLPEEDESLSMRIELCTQAIIAFGLQGINLTMNQFNSKLN